MQMESLMVWGQFCIKFFKSLYIVCRYLNSKGCGTILWYGICHGCCTLNSSCSKVVNTALCDASLGCDITAEYYGSSWDNMMACFHKKCSKKKKNRIRGDKILFQVKEDSWMKICMFLAQDISGKINSGGLQSIWHEGSNFPQF